MCWLLFWNIIVNIFVDIILFELFYTPQPWLVNKQTHMSISMHELLTQILRGSHFKLVNFLWFQSWFNAMLCPEVLFFETKTSNRSSVVGGKDVVVPAADIFDQLKICIPGSISIPEDLRQVLNDDNEFYRVEKDFPFHLLVREEFIQTFVENGKLFLQTFVSSNDSDHFLAILPSGNFSPFRLSLNGMVPSLLTIFGRGEVLNTIYLVKSGAHAFNISCTQINILTFLYLFSAVCSVPYDLNLRS